MRDVSYSASESMAAIMLKSRSRSLRNALLKMTMKSKSETIVILRRLRFADEEFRLGRRGEI